MEHALLTVTDTIVLARTDGLVSTVHMVSYLVNLVLFLIQKHIWRYTRILNNAFLRTLVLWMQHPTVYLSINL